MSPLGSKDWVAESPESISARLSSANASQAQTRATLGWMAIISAMMLIASYNAYLSYDYHYFLKVAEELKDGEADKRSEVPERPGLSIPNILLEQAAKDWATSRTIHIGLIGLRVSVDDAAVLGTAVLALQSFWLVLLTRRENHTIGSLLRDTDASAQDLSRDRVIDDADAQRKEINDRRWLIFHAVSANAVFETPNGSLMSVYSLRGANPLHAPDTSFRGRVSKHGFRVLRSFFFVFPVFTSLMVFAMDRASYFMRDPFDRDTAGMGFNDPFFWPSLAAFVVLFIPLALCCRKASRFSRATEAVLREYGAKLMADLRPSGEHALRAPESV
jgi:hypothetical protein